MREAPTHSSPLKSWWRRVLGQPEREHRHASRIPFSGGVEIKNEAGEHAPGIARDLSVKGMGAIVAAEFQVGERVAIRYSHPLGADQKKELTRRALVRDRYGRRYGFEFDQPSEHWVPPAPERE
ncbi:MAG TPA: PilZ domain-containing protein [Terriglobia bacterium]|nr:PilZ domain-containing protein [Terriglobia bacterium]